MTAYESFKRSLTEYRDILAIAHVDTETTRLFDADIFTPTKDSFFHAWCILKAETAFFSKARFLIRTAGAVCRWQNCESLVRELQDSQKERGELFDGFVKAICEAEPYADGIFCQLEKLSLDIKTAAKVAGRDSAKRLDWQMFSYETRAFARQWNNLLDRETSIIKYFLSEGAENALVGGGEFYRQKDMSNEQLLAALRGDAQPPRISAKSGRQDVTMEELVERVNAALEYYDLVAYYKTGKRKGEKRKFCLKTLQRWEAWWGNREDGIKPTRPPRDEKGEYIYTPRTRDNDDEAAKFIAAYVRLQYARLSERREAAERARGKIGRSDVPKRLVNIDRQHVENQKGSDGRDVTARIKFR